MPWSGGGASAVLFESESVRGNTQTSKEKRQALTSDAGGCSGSSDGAGAVAFAKNTRDELHVQGDGTISGALAAQPGMKQQTYVLASDHSHAEIGMGGVATTILAHAEKAAPILVQSQAAEKTM